MKQKIGKTTFAILFVCIAAFLLSACAKDEHWGQKLDIKGKWWKKEGQSWNPKEKIFMAIGYSNPDWKNKFDQRKSADMNARSEVASFMQSLVKNYMKEVRAGHYAISQGTVESSSNETLLGAVIVARHYAKKKYESLIKVDLNYFFSQIYDNYESAVAETGSADARIKAKSKEAIAKLKEMENSIVERTISEGGAQ